MTLLRNIFNEQHWNLVNIVFMVAKLGNICLCFENNICVREAKTFLTSGKNNFRFRAANVVSATLVSRADKLGNICLLNNVYVTKYPSLARPLPARYTWDQKTSGIYIVAHCLSFTVGLMSVLFTVPCTFSGPGPVFSLLMNQL